MNKMITPITSEVASEGGHWYRQEDGSPCHTVIGKNGKERPTTLRDAKKFGLVPSVTTVMKFLPKPALVKWIQRQIAESAVTLPIIAGETGDNYIKRILIDADEQSRKAREKGVEIHGAIEKWLQGQEIEREYLPYVEGSLDALAQHLSISRENLISNCKPEKSFACAEGYGGKVDLHSQELNFVCDFKTKDFNKTKKAVVYNENIIQLHAYAKGLLMPNARLLNVFISTSQVGLVTIFEHKFDGYYLNVFNALLNLWQRINIERR